METAAEAALHDTSVRAITPFMPPRALKEAFPAGDAVAALVARSRETIRRILRRDDPRLLVVVGPCSIHDPDAALDYAHRLADAKARFEDRLFLVMRTYFEKPRTTVGWEGLINDPHLDGSFDMTAGLTAARKLLLDVTRLGLPVATEMLDPVTPQYVADLVSWAAIGARTTESQTHRALASGLSMPVGFKNGTDGGLQIAIDAMVSAAHPHSFLGINYEGYCSIVTTKGNPDTHLILRGGRGSGPNYDAESVARAVAQMRRAGHEPALMVDCSHANSGYEPEQQKAVWNDVIAQRANGSDVLVGMMLESNLGPGKQSIPDDPGQLRYGVSITDPCLAWEDTLALLEDGYRRLGPA